MVTNDHTNNNDNNDDDNKSHSNDNLQGLTQ